MRGLSLSLSLGLVLWGAAFAAAPPETRKEFDILAEADQSVRGVTPTRCFGAPRSFHTLAHACYTVAARDVPRVVRILERRLDHPPLLTHGDNWHAHGFGRVPLPDDMRASLAHRADPTTMVIVINFTASSKIKPFKSFKSNVTLPKTADLGSQPGFIYVQVLPRMPTFRE